MDQINTELIEEKENEGRLVIQNIKDTLNDILQ